jgi:hypothetical protein
VRNVLRYRKPGFWVSVAAIVLVAVVSLSLIISRQVEEMPESSKEEGESSALQEAAYVSEYTDVTIEFLSENKGFKSANKFETTHSKPVAYIDSTIKASMSSAQKVDLNNNDTNQYTIKLSNEIGGYSCGLYYDTLSDKAYIVKDGGLFETETDFARYIDSLFENTQINFTINDDDAKRLFQSYGWTLDYQINSMKSKLGDINVLSAFQANTY